MKYLVISFVSLISLSSFARTNGTPDEDPTVANVRTRFEQGSQPAVDYLLNTTFKCKELVARKGEFEKEDYSSELRFEEFDNYIIPIQENSIMHKVLYVFNGSELIGSVEHHYDAYRVDSKGILISEYTTIGPYPTAVILPIAASVGKVSSYTICVPNK